MHVTSEPAILYFGTPVVLISSANEDGSSNLAPMSSAFWLGWRCVLGLSAISKTPQT
jgi:flavin reductase (DIM6/NTAB) family NADH-FMN oxidoreductase RutF